MIEVCLTIITNPQKKLPKFWERFCIFLSYSGKSFFSNFFEPRM